MRPDVVDHRLDLLNDQRGIQTFDPADRLRILNREQCDDGFPINPELVKGFEIRLYARATARIGAGDGEGNSRHWMDVFPVWAVPEAFVISTCAPAMLAIATATWKTAFSVNKTPSVEFSKNLR